MSISEYLHQVFLLPSTEYVSEFAEFVSNQCLSTYRIKRIKSLIKFLSTHFDTLKVKQITAVKTHHSCKQYIFRYMCSNMR